MFMGAKHGAKQQNELRHKWNLKLSESSVNQTVTLDIITFGFQ